MYSMGTQNKAYKGPSKLLLANSAWHAQSVVLWSVSLRIGIPEVPSFHLLYIKFTFCLSKIIPGLRFTDIENRVPSSFLGMEGASNTTLS